MSHLISSTSADSTFSDWKTFSSATRGREDLCPVIYSFATSSMFLASLFSRVDGWIQKVSSASSSFLLWVISSSTSLVRWDPSRVDHHRSPHDGDAASSHLLVQSHLLCDKRAWREVTIDTMMIRQEMMSRCCRFLLSPLFILIRIFWRAADRCLGSKIRGWEEMEEYDDRLKEGSIGR